MPNLTDHLKFYDREDRPWTSTRLTSAAIVGHTTADSTRLWIRVWEPGTYTLVVSESPIGTNSDPSVNGRGKVVMKPRNGGPDVTLEAKVLTENLSYETDLTYVFDVSELKPGTRYNYAVFRSDGDRSEPWEIARDYRHSFRTQAVQPERVVFGLYSCHMPFDGRSVRNLHMWESFHQMLSLSDADFVIGAGDQVYTDGDPQISIWNFLKVKKDEVAKLTKKDRQQVMLSWYRDIYRGYWGDRAVRRVFRSFPNYMIWDDHEIMDGWGSYTNKELSNQLDTLWEWENPGRNLALARDMFEAAKLAYAEYEHSHNPITKKGEWHYPLEWSLGLRLFFLDMRGHATTTERSRKTARFLDNSSTGRFTNGSITSSVTRTLPSSLSCRRSPSFTSASSSPTSPICRS